MSVNDSSQKESIDLLKMPLSPDDLEVMPADTDKIVESVMQEYDSPAQAIQYNVIQNSWGARVGEDGRVGNRSIGLFPNWRIEIRYDPEAIILDVEDFGTTGIIEWEKYRGIGFTSKDLAVDEGGWGEGSKVLSSAGERVYTETLLTNGTRRSDLWVKGRRHRNPPCLNLVDHVGTLIRIYNVYDTVHDQPLREILEDEDAFVRLIQLTWDEIIRRHGATIVYKCKKTIEVFPLEWPKPTCHEKYKDVKVAGKTKEYGVMPVVYLALAEKEIPEDLRGIHVRVFGQTVERISHPGLTSTLASRFYGWSNSDFLATSKSRGHQSFRGKSWGEAKKLLERMIIRFKDNYLAREAATESKYRSMSNALLRQINICLQSVPELDPSGFGISPRRKRVPPPPPTQPGIDYIDLENRQYNPGDTVKGKAYLSNRVEGRSFPDCRLTIEFYDSMGSRLGEQAFDHINLDPGSESEFTFAQKLADTATNGQYNIVGMLWGPSELYDTATATFLVGPEIKLEKKAEADKTKEKEKGRQTRGLRDIRAGRFRKIAGEPEPESAFGEEQLILYANTDHRSWQMAEELNPKTLWMHVARCAVNELTALKMQRGIDELFSKDEISPRELVEMPDRIKSIQENVKLLSAKFMAKFAEQNVRVKELPPTAR